MKLKGGACEYWTFGMGVRGGWGTHDAEEVVVRDAEDTLGLLDGVLEAGLSDLGPVRAAQRFGLELGGGPPGR